MTVLQNGNLVSSSWDATIKIWNPTTGELIQTLVCHVYRIYALTVLQNFNLASGSYQEIKIWNPNTGALIHTFNAHKLWVLTLICPPEW